MSRTELTLGIVTISYNQATYLAEAIESVRLSDPGRLRYVIVDPGSTDGSREIIESHKDRFSAILLDPDRGPADGLNKGFARCDADVYGFLNSDDRFPAGALDWVLAYFERHPEVEMIMGAVRLFDQHGKSRWWPHATAWGFSARGYLERTCCIAQQGTFFRRQAWERVEGFNIENRTCWDSELFVDMALAGARTRQVHRVLGEFRMHPASIGGLQLLKDRHVEDLNRIDRKIISHGLQPSPTPLLRLKRAAFRLHPVRQALRFLVH